MKSLYLIFGDEDYLIGKAISSLKKNFQASSIEIYDDSIPPEKIIESLSLTSLFTAERLVILTDINLTQADWLLESICSLPAGTVLALAPSSINRRSRLYKHFEEQGEVMECKAFAPWEEARLTDWIVREAAASQKKIAPSVARLLIEIVGTDLRMLSSEIDKLVTYLGERPQLDEDDIYQVAVSGEIDAYALVNSLRQKNLPASLVLLERSFKEKADPPKILAQIASQLSMGLLVKSYLSQNSGREALGLLAAQVASSPFYLKKCQEFAAGLSIKALQTGLKKSLETDLGIKSGGQPQILLPLLVEAIQS